MEDLTNKSKDATEKQFHEGVAEPNDPSGFLLKILGRTKDDPYHSYPEDQIPEGETLDTLRAKLPARRELMQSAFVRIQEVASDMIRTYKEICKNNGFEPGIVRLYVVGGRVRHKPLSHG
ncbi:MAG: hypothetical protein AAB734_03310, partial [Patescibacteria group bacterium]